MRCLSFFINNNILGKQLFVGTCLKCLTVAMTLLQAFSIINRENRSARRKGSLMSLTNYCRITYIFLHLDDPQRLEHTPGDVRPVVESTTLTTRS